MTLLKKYFVVDASCLIILHKIQALDIMKKMMMNEYPFIITAKVKEEVKNIEDIIKCLSCDNLIEDEIPDQQIYDRIDRRFPMLGKGEKSVISVSLQNKYAPNCTILDDGIARKKAEILGIPIHGTLWLIEKFYKLCMIAKNVALAYLRKIRNSRFRIDPKIILEFIRRISANNQKSE